VRQRVIETNDIQDHANAIREMVEISMRDPATRKLAGQIVSGHYEWLTDPRTGLQVPAVEYHGRYYRVSPNTRPPIVCQGRDYTCELTQIWNFMVLNTRYTGDADGSDDYQDLRTTLESGIADCDDATISFCALLRSIGFRCYARVISLDAVEWAHVYPMAEDPDGRITALDITEVGKVPGWEFDRPAAKVDFLLGDG